VEGANWLAALIDKLQLTKLARSRLSGSGQVIPGLGRIASKNIDQGTPKRIAA
jgi:hypothetical protein